MTECGVGFQSFSWGSTANLQRTTDIPRVKVDDSLILQVAPVRLGLKLSSDGTIPGSLILETLTDHSFPRLGRPLSSSA